MKKSLVLLLVLLLIPYISAAYIDMKSSYDQGETIIAKVYANFYTNLEENNVFFYRGHVKIPMDYDVGKVGDYYYIKASTLGKSPNNYSLQIKNAHYYDQGFLIDDDIIKQFSITQNTADFSINPGFVISIGNFSIEITGVQNTPVPLTINSFSGISSQESLTISPGQNKKIDFDTSKIQESVLGNIEIKSSNFIYNVPTYIIYQPEPPQEPYCGDGRVDPGEQCDNKDWGPITGCDYFGFNDGTLSCNYPGTVGECNFDLQNCFDSTNIECMEDEDCDNDEICIDNNCVYIEPEKECDNGETKCEGKVYYLCENDKWESQGQVDGKCGYTSNPGECTTGMTKCESTVYYICENEKWISKGQVDGKCGYLEQLEPYCGDENLDTNLGEQCDGYDWGSVASCRDFDFNLGTLDCIECIFDTSACYNRTRSDECWYNSDCSDGYKCENLECVIDTVKRCSSPSDCDINELCIKRVCVNGQECVYKRDCIAGKICAEGRCVYPDYECIQDIDCEDNEECDRGYCVEKENIECRYNRDCDKGEECDDGKCIEAPDCIKDEDCGSGYKCEDDHCEKEVGEECSLTKLCSENHYCEDGYCIKEDELEVECETFRDCDFGFTCLKNECVNRTTSKTCDGLGGDLCASTQECKGSYEEIRGVICCLDVLCTEKEQSSTGKFIGWGLIIIVGLALVFFFFKYKGTKRRVTSFRKIGLRR